MLDKLMKNFYDEIKPQNNLLTFNPHRTRSFWEVKKLIPNSICLPRRFVNKRPNLFRHLFSSHLQFSNSNDDTQQIMSTIVDVWLNGKSISNKVGS